MEPAAHHTVETHVTEPHPYHATATYYPEAHHTVVETHVPEAHAVDHHITDRPHHSFVETTSLISPASYRYEPHHDVVESVETTVSTATVPHLPSLHIAGDIVHNPDQHYSTYHETHHELDHHYDDAHDVTPVAYHDSRVLHSLPHADS